jgi:hypothetical protein
MFNAPFKSAINAARALPVISTMTVDAINPENGVCMISLKSR